MPILSPRARLLAATLVLVALVAVLLVLLRPRNLTDDGPLGPLGAMPNAPDDAEVLLAVGDTGSCSGSADDAVADLASQLPGPIALLGDLAYPDGTADDFRDCFGGAWGELRDRLRPAPGNHEYNTAGAAPYFDWFGSLAGEPGQGWYSYDLGAWHVVTLNSNCGDVGCDAGGAQAAWLAQDLAEHDSARGAGCLLAYWHHPRYASGRHGSSAAVAGLWEPLVAAGVDVVLNGHDHSYERIAADGAREFVVGTGGRSLYDFDDPPLPATESRHAGSHGLLWLALSEGAYRWEYMPLGETTYTDAGQGDCDGT
jgi:alkaline phosphatase